MISQDNVIRKSKNDLDLIFTNNEIKHKNLYHILDDDDDDDDDDYDDDDDLNTPINGIMVAARVRSVMFSRE